MVNFTIEPRKILRKLPKRQMRGKSQSNKRKKKQWKGREDCRLLNGKGSKGKGK